jgi:hypothetical protein
MYDLSDEALQTLDYLGAFRDDQFGQATGPYTYPSDLFCLNNFLPAITNSPNVIKTKQDNSYFGNFNEKGEREGYGVVITRDGHHFSGIFAGDMPQGPGRIIYNNGDYLISNFTFNQIGSSGELHFLTKDTVYKGQFRENMPNGQGELQSSSGEAGYSGNWKNGQKHGYGTEKWEDGTIYEGDFQEGQKHGNGKFTWPDGASYEGQFKLNSIHGLGTHTWGDGRMFVGGWKDNKMHGKLLTPKTLNPNSLRQRKIHLEGWHQV